MKNLTVNKLKTAAILLASTMAFGGAIPVQAAPSIVDSTPSSATDATVGKDSTQGTSTKYGSETIKETTYSGSNAVTLYATKAGWATVTIPKTLVLGPEKGSSNYACTFDVAIAGDIAGAQSVTVTPAATAILTEKGGKKTPVACNVNINDQKSLTVGANDLLNGKTVHATGKITTSGVTAGAYNTDLNFGVVVNYTE